MTRSPADVHAALHQCPWRDARVALIAVSLPGGSVGYAKTIDEKRSLLQGVPAETRVLVAWPGRWAQDVFELARAADRDQVLRWLTNAKEA